MSRHDIASIWVAFFHECQQYRCGQVRKSAGSPLCAQAPPDSADSSAMPPSAAGVRFTGAASGRFYGLSLDHFATYLVAGDALLSVSGAKTGSDTSPAITFTGGAAMI